MAATTGGEACTRTSAISSWEVGSSVSANTKDTRSISEKCDVRDFIHCLYVIEKFYCVHVATGCRDLFTHVGAGWLKSLRGD